MATVDLSLVSVDPPNIKSVALILHQNPLIQKDWLTFARGLGTPDNRIKKFKDDLHLHKITLYDLICDVTGLWIGRHGSNANWSTFLSVIEDDYGALDSGELLRLEFHFPCRHPKADQLSISWNDLSPAFQTRVIHNLKNISPTKPIQDIHHELKGTLLINLMTGKTNLFKTTLPQQLSYYVNRIVLPRNIISIDIFQHANSDILLVTGMTRNQLAGLAKTEAIRSSSEQMKIITVRFIILDDPHHFDKICAKTDCPIHWLNYEHGELMWICSRGEVRTLQDYINKPQQDQTEETFLSNMTQDQHQQPVCISDSPGMGKTVLLARIGNELNKTNPEKTVIFLPLAELIQTVKQSSSKVSISKFLEVIQTLACDNELGRAVLRSIVWSTQKGKLLLELFLDGLDEVPVPDLKFTYELLQTIRSSFSSTRLWVSTRPHLLTELENKLSVLGYNIKPFDKDDQLRFLTMYWSPQRSYDLQRLAHFAVKCLDTLKSNVKTKEHEIAGIPLQCLLIGEVYEEEALAYAISAEHSTAIPQVLINSVSDLYKFVVAKKFQKYLTIHQRNNFEGTRALIDMHAGLSLQLLFPESFKKLNNLFDPVNLEEILKVGIMEATSSTSKIPTFIHRTFADYLIAYFIADRIAGDIMTLELAHFLIGIALGSRPVHYTLYNGRFDAKSFEFVHPVIAYFLNALMAELQLAPRHSLELLELSSSSGERMKEIAHSCVTSDFVHLLQFHFNPNTLGIHLSTIFDDGFIYLAIIKGSLPLLKLALEHFEGWHEFSQECQNRSLRYSVIRGAVSIFEFLIKEKQLRLIIQEVNPRTRLLLLDCVKFSRKHSEQEISAKIQVMRMLAGVNPKLLEAEDEEGETPLLTHQVHVRLLTELIKLGADVFAQNQFDDTFLHSSLFHMSSMEYHTLLMSIPLEQLRKLAGQKGMFGRTPLARLIESLEPLEVTIDRFKLSGQDFNCLDDSQSSLLASAIGRGWGVKTLKKLIECGASVAWKGERECKSLLHVAAEYRNLEAVSFLLEEHGMDVNSEDKDGFTPLDYTIRNDRLIDTQPYEEDRLTLLGIASEPSKIVGCFEIGLALSKRGARYTDKVDGSTWLPIMAERGKFTSVRLLLALGMDINLPDEEGNTALHGWVKTKRNFFHHSGTKFLLENKADPNILNKEGETPLQVALKNPRMDFDTFQLLKSKTKDMEWTPLYSSLALSILVRDGNLLEEQKISALFTEFEDSGADLGYVNELGDSLLLIAVGSTNDWAIRHLVSSRAAPVNSLNKVKETPLIISGQVGGILFRMETIKYLIDNGADAYPKDKDRNNFLHYLAQYSYTMPSDFHSMVEYLVGKGYLNLFQTPGGELDATPTHLAVLKFEPELRTLRILHSNNFDFNLVDSQGDSLLAYAIRGRRSVKLLASVIEAFGADVKIRNKNRKSLLHLAGRDGTLEAMDFLLSLGVLDVNERSLLGDTPLHLAAQLKGRVQDYEVLDKCKLLISKGADVNILDNQGISPLTINEGWGGWEHKFEVVQLLRNCVS